MKLEKIYTDKVWADEIFYSSETKDNILVNTPLGVTFTSTSTITGEATVAVVSCELSEAAGVVTATVEFMVQEDLIVEASTNFDKEYEYRYTRDFIFQKLELPADVNIEDLRCQVFRFQGNVELTNINLPEGGTTGTFDNLVTAMTKLKVTEGIQTFVALGTAPYVRTVTVTTP